MKRPVKPHRAWGLVTVLAALAGSAGAHSASDAYLTISGTGQAAAPLQGQWDVALRDLDFVLGLDADGDGNITWAELKRRQADISRYVMAGLKLSSGKHTCRITPGRQLVDRRADGSYAALFFDIDCGPGARTLTLDYSLFFKIDPSHRAILVSRQGSDAATGLLSPEHARVELRLRPPR